MPRRRWAAPLLLALSLPLLTPLAASGATSTPSASHASDASGAPRAATARASCSTVSGGWGRCMTPAVVSSSTPKRVRAQPSRGSHTLLYRSTRDCGPSAR